DSSVIDNPRLAEAIRKLTVLLHILQAARAREVSQPAEPPPPKTLAGQPELPVEAPRMRSDIWETFKILRNGQEARCQTCGEKVPIAKENGRHKNLTDHRNRHEGTASKRPFCPGQGSSAKVKIAQNVSRLFELKCMREVPEYPKFQAAQTAAAESWRNYWENFDEEYEEKSWIPELRSPPVVSLEQFMANVTTADPSEWIRSHRDEFRNAIFISMYERLYTEIENILYRASRHP
ncbi:hypothetical protein AAVH_30001, partial [Aphelenchoides avenae]